MKKYILLAVLLYLIIPAGAQTSLYMPREIKQAYNNGTRSLDGNPGKNY